jgi:branched-chain amino acid transport system substrate-binding protein
VALGPYNSGSGKAMSPILSAAGLAIITPTSTNPDITDPKFAQIYRPQGPAIYFRTVSTDAFQGPNMANFYAQVLKVPSVYVLDDGGAYGVGIADTFEAQVHGPNQLTGSRNSGESQSRESLGRMVRSKRAAQHRSHPL